MAINSVSLTGYLGKDPEVKIYGDKAKVIFSICQNKVSKKKEEQIWIPVEAWGVVATFLSTYIKKGDFIAIDGKLNYSSWKTEEGELKSRLFVVAESVESPKRK